MDQHLSIESIKQRVRDHFLAELPGRLEQCRTQIDQLTPGVDDLDALKRLHLLFHNLKGTAASLDLTPCVIHATAAEEVLHEAMQGQQHVVNDALLQHLNAHMRALIHWTTSPSSEAPSSALSLAVNHHESGHQAGLRDRLPIYLCDPDSGQRRQLAHQLGCFGYHLECFTDRAQLYQAIDRQPPGAVIINLIFPPEQSVDSQRLVELNPPLSIEAPCIVLSHHDDFDARLHSVRLGATAFCPQPVNIAELIECLDQLTNRVPAEAFNILIVDDDPQIARLHAATLGAANMNCRVVTDPSQVLGMLANFRADLVLMDLHMPDCSGQELAQVLRQIPGYVSLPIIYVSAETNQERRFQALQAGADGFLVKPIASDCLVEEVRLRAERMRTLRSLMVRDSLTGLFNHSAILQFLDLAVANARRKGGELCLAMIDVDYFKQVNDTYGHPAGDHVLMALSRTLRLHLRDSDLIGRYGGEEFAIVLNDSHLDNARRVLEALREDFSRIEFHANGQPFRCTFSAGLAVFPDCPDTPRLTETADRALYRAKREGRNRVASLACQAGEWP